MQCNILGTITRMSSSSKHNPGCFSDQKGESNSTHPEGLINWLYKCQSLFSPHLQYYQSWRIPPIAQQCKMGAALVLMSILPKASTGCYTQWETQFFMYFLNITAAEQKNIQQSELNRTQLNAFKSKMQDGTIPICNYTWFGTWCRNFRNYALFLHDENQENASFS